MTPFNEDKVSEVKVLAKSLSEKWSVDGETISSDDLVDLLLEKFEDDVKSCFGDRASEDFIGRGVDNFLLGMPDVLQAIITGDTEGIFSGEISVVKEQEDGQN